ncbi:MAG: TetR/AcrR family transcriptional regulator [Desulfobacteraceae bacterium]|nr:MAG: TetR/AcrR family transcriptional regulator [Desulfobacteraceae bacterium]
MPNKTKYTRSDVIEAGLNQLRDDGWDGLTPKKVAARLGASTMPIYSHFPAMADFKKALMDRAWQMMETYALDAYTGDPWVDHGVGYVLFARDNGRLFSCMHSESLEQVRERRYQFWLTISKDLSDYPLFRDMDPELAGWIRNLRSFLVYGIAVSVNTGLTPVWENEAVIRQMVSLCSDVLREGLAQNKDKLDQTLNLIPREARERISQISLETD